MQEVITFPSGQVKYLFESSIDALWQQYKPEQVILITDAHVAALYPQMFTSKRTIVLPAGEHSKSLATVEDITKQLLAMQATRSAILIGIGGGVISDITGFVASVYMRGIKFGFIPTTLLSMVDAAIGGKNGVNVGFNKNVTGTINQPDLILFDTAFLKTLPDTEWSNGFAEIIKYACLFDAELFRELSEHNIAYYQQNEAALQKVTARCVALKNKTVIEDEHEKGLRKLLNFGHTAAHAIENLYDLPHGQAVAIGMVIAATLSEHVTDLPPAATTQLKNILQQYKLPISYPIELGKAMDILKMDKKRTDESIDFILLHKIGEATIRPLPFDIIQKAIATTCAQ